MKPADELGLMDSDERLTNHDPRPPFAVIGISSDKEQGDKLDGEDDTSEIKHDSAD